VLLIIALVFIFRTDGQQSNLRISAYEALMEMIKNSPKDCYPVVRSTTMTILKKIEHLLAIEAHLTSATDRSQFVDLQALLCNTLTVSGAHTSCKFAVGDFKNVYRRCPTNQRSVHDGIAADDAEIGADGGWW
jgi:hypothetical protein